MNGFQAKLGITNPNQFADTDIAGATGTPASKQDRFGLEGQVEYSFAMGKVWSSFASYEVTTGATDNISYDANVIDFGASVNVGNAGITAYIYNGEGVGTTTFGGIFGGAPGGADAGVSAAGKTRDSSGGYIQGTYVIPTGTKLGVAYGVSNLDLASDETANALVVEENNRWTVGAYHPLTKHLNLVAEYNAMESTDQANSNAESQTVSLGAILFF